MRWYLKGLAFKAISLLPGGVKLYNYAQHNISRSTQATRPRAEQKLQIALLYWDWLKRNGRTEALTDGVVLDYGSGWHPTIPVFFHAVGAKRQLLLDVNPLLTPQLVADTVKTAREVMDDPAWSGRNAVLRPPAVPSQSGQTLTEILRQYGFEYYAPYQTVFPGEKNSVNAVFSTQVIQHIPDEFMVDAFRQIYSWLKPGGIFLATIHLTFQFAAPDTNPREYQHLTISPWAWKTFFSSRLMHFNRFKAPDYRAALEKAGFRVIEMDVTPGNATDKGYFARTKVHECFKHLSPEDASAKHIFFVAEKPSTVAR